MVPGAESCCLHWARQVLSSGRALTHTCFASSCLSHPGQALPGSVSGFPGSPHSFLCAAPHASPSPTPRAQLLAHQHTARALPLLLNNDLEAGETTRWLLTKHMLPRCRGKEGERGHEEIDGKKVTYKIKGEKTKKESFLEQPLLASGVFY